jgi:hypothetical protein
VYSAVSDWDEDRDPVIGQTVLVVDGDGRPFEAKIDGVDTDGTIALVLPVFAAWAPRPDSDPKIDHYQVVGAIAWARLDLSSMVAFPVANDVPRAWTTVLAERRPVDWCHEPLRPHTDVPANRDWALVIGCAKELVEAVAKIVLEIRCTTYEFWQ